MPKQVKVTAITVKHTKAPTVQTKEHERGHLCTVVEGTDFKKGTVPDKAKKGDSVTATVTCRISTYTWLAKQKDDKEYPGVWRKQGGSQLKNFKIQGRMTSNDVMSANNFQIK